MLFNKKEHNNKFQFPLYVVKKIGLKKWKYWLIRGGGIILAFLVAAITCTILKPGTFGLFFHELFRGCFDFSDISTVIDMLAIFAVLLMIAIILTPSFKMKYWNIGAEGQILMGCLGAAWVARFAPSDMPNFVILILACFCASVFASIWATIPAIFKAFFNTNETLFTLMLNYVAALISALAISVWVKSGSQSFGVLSQGIFPDIFDNSATLVIVIAVIIFVGMYFYIKKGKAGYEVSVIGESINTARYIGVNVRLVTIRTVAISGALFGIVGFLIVCGIHQSFSPTIVAGKGFTGVLIAWLGHFDPFEIALFSFLAAVMEQGTTTAASAVSISSAQFSAICTGIFFFVIIACEFFSKYEIKIRHKEKIVEVEASDHE